ncbi:unnamed protein product (macronuclear) [Paramecium tetraurelia]|uniref:Uncharacterized protein n=1 Tax=Paramecium tetraurelia TaxID=5888 RepID=A0E8P8_PARTE|nr:uncharacterized protein GSPATT00024394001 [Paramecium tetraurelia]CAK91665.1 unnamed protein product [Paramecium tetraurelia]|eukprot:XP_001459062.1 hypothetical protein (macronuclear) [Paramecium tetraurelia strain d4-2]
MYSCDILPLPGQQFRYAKNLNLLRLDNYSKYDSNGHNFSQDQQSSTRIRKPTSKLKLLSVCNLVVIVVAYFKEGRRQKFLSSHFHLQFKGIQQFNQVSCIFVSTPKYICSLSGNTQKLNEMQAKVLLTDFQRKVTAYLKKVPNSNNNKQYYSDIKLPGYSKDYETQQIILHTQQEELLNRSLCLNKYNYRPEFSDVGLEVRLMNNTKSFSKQVIPNERIQNRLLKFMEKYLNDEHIDYDLKMQMMTKQYREIVKKIKTQAFKVKVPDHYQIQMSDFNDYYQVNERKQREYLEQQFDSLADQIIQSIQQSQDSMSSYRESQSDIYELEHPQATPNNHKQEIQQEELNEIDEDDDTVNDMKKSKKTGKQKDPKKLTKKQSIKVQRPSTLQRQESDVIQQLSELNNQNLQREQRQPTVQQIEPIQEEELKQTIQELTEELQKPHKKHLTKAQREEQKKRKKEIQRLHEDIERIKKEKGGDFEYEKSDSDSEDRFRRQKLYNQFDDMFKPRQLSRRQSHQHDQSEGEDLDYASEQEVEDRNKIQRVEQIIQQKRDPNYQYNPQEFWQQEVKINVKKPQFPNVVSQQRQQEQFLQFQREKLEQQMQMINQKYTQQPNDTSQQQPNNLQQQIPTQQQQQQQSYQFQQQIKNNQQQIHPSNKNNPQQQSTPIPQQDERQKQHPNYSVQKSFKTPQSMPSQQNNQDSLPGIQDHSFDTKQNSQPILPFQAQEVQNGVAQIKNQTQNKNKNQQQQQFEQSDQKQKQKQQGSSANKKQEQPTSDNKGRQIPSMKKLDQEDAQISKEIEEQLRQVQYTLNRVKMGMYEKMMAAQSVYDVDIHEYKLIDFPLNQTVFPKLNGEDEKLIFQQLFAWQKEIYKTIPILHQVNRNLQIPDENEGAASQLVSSDDDNN